MWFHERGIPASDARRHRLGQSRSTVFKAPRVVRVAEDACRSGRQGRSGGRQRSGAGGGEYCGFLNARPFLSPRSTRAQPALSPQPPTASPKMREFLFEGPRSDASSPPRLSLLLPLLRSISWPALAQRANCERRSTPSAGGLPGTRTGQFQYSIARRRRGTSCRWAGSCQIMPTSATGRLAQRPTAPRTGRGTGPPIKALMAQRAPKVANGRRDTATEGESMRLVRPESVYGVFR